MTESLLWGFVEVALDLGFLPFAKPGEGDFVDVIESLCAHASEDEHAVFVEFHSGAFSGFRDCSFAELALPVCFKEFWLFLQGVVLIKDFSIVWG